MCLRTTNESNVLFGGWRISKKGEDGHCRGYHSISFPGPLESATENSCFYVIKIVTKRSVVQREDKPLAVNGQNKQISKNKNEQINTKKVLSHRVVRRETVCQRFLNNQVQIS